MRLAILLLALPLLAADRATISLDGSWQLAPSKAALPFPAAYPHTAPVPGLAHSATPAIPDIDAFDSREVIQNRVSKGMLPKSALVQSAGVPRQENNYLFYRRTVDLPAPRQSAVLRINKAQFGASVWVNGQLAGEHLPCFTAAVFDISRLVRWNASNEIVIRIGAHPGVLPPTVNGGTDFEKNRWTPGIYDSVSLQLADNPTIQSIQVAPRLSDSSITIQTVLANHSLKPAVFRLQHRVHAWKSTAAIAESQPLAGMLPPGTSRTFTETLPLPNARLWTPEQPNLYVLESNSAGDSASTRFGMREFRFDTPTKRAYLNGKPYFLRGSNVTLHRFFEDPLSSTLPWDETWVRKLLIDIPKRLHWNAFRFCIGPVPDRWLDIADEAGLLIQNEYFIWTGRAWHGVENQTRFSPAQLKTEYTEWLHDNWNHPSVAIWDANNETWDPIFKDIINAVRPLDLSRRPWENSYNEPAGPDDPVEDHPYEFQRMADGGPDFSMTEFEQPGHFGPRTATAHAMILNEYGWTWLNRDGSPTELTKKLYPRLLGPDSTPRQRLDLNAYLLGGITEYWRAYRFYAGVLHFVYLMSSDPLGYTADHFQDVKALKLDPAFEDYMAEAFKPLGVYLSFWQKELKTGAKPTFTVMLVNDEATPVAGKLNLILAAPSGTELARQTVPFSMKELGAETLYIDLQIPAQTGKALLKAEAEYSTGKTTSRRQVTLK